jgi:hypothetical protein
MNTIAIYKFCFVILKVSVASVVLFATSIFVNDGLIFYLCCFEPAKLFCIIGSSKKLERGEWVKSIRQKTRNWAGKSR